MPKDRYAEHRAKAKEVREANNTFTIDSYLTLYNLEEAAHYAREQGIQWVDVWFEGKHVLTINRLGDVRFP